MAFVKSAYCGPELPTIPTSPKKEHTPNTQVAKNPEFTESQPVTLNKHSHREQMSKRRDESAGSDAFYITGIWAEEKATIIECNSDPSFYYIAYWGESADTANQPVALAIGEDGFTKLSAPGIPTTNIEGFICVERIQLTYGRDHCVDTDGDGIDDVHELERPGYLDPLNSKDATEDVDGDGATSLEEYLAGTDADNFSDVPFREEVPFDKKVSLLPTSLNTTSMFPEPGESIHVGLTIVNRSEHLVENLEVVLTVTGETVGTQYTTIPPFGTKTLDWSWSSKISGTFTFTAMVDPNRRYFDRDPSDNVITTDVVVVPRPPPRADFAVQSLKFKESSELIYPSDWNREPFKPGRLLLVVKNIGESAADVPILIRVNDSIAAVRIVSNVEPGKEREIEIPYGVESPIAKLSATINPRFSTSEPNPNDNSITAHSDLDVDLLVKELSIHAEAFEESKSRDVTIGYCIVNKGSLAITTPFKSSVYPGTKDAEGVFRARMISHDSLGPGEIMYVSHTCKSAPEEFEAIVHVDVDDVVSEGNEDNNRSTGYFKNPTPNVDRWVSIGPKRITTGQRYRHAIGRLSAIAIDPNNPNVIYVGGHRCGVWKTADGGATWRSLTDGLTMSVANLAIDPTDSDQIYLVTTQEGVFLSPDTGTSWKHLSRQNLNANSHWGELLIDTRSAKTKELMGFYADASVLLAKSLKAGETLGSIGSDTTDYNLHYNWSNAQSPERLMVTLIEKSDRMVMLRLEEGKKAMGDFYGKVSVIWASYGVDFGSEAANSTDQAMHTNWAQRQSADRIKNQLKMRVEKIFTQFSDSSKRLFLASRSGVWRSLDGGASWTVVRAGHAIDLIMDPSNANVLYAALYDGQDPPKDTSIYITWDGGDNWNEKITGCPGGQLPVASQRGDMFLLTQSKGIMYVGFRHPDGFRVYRSSDGIQCHIGERPERLWEKMGNSSYVKSWYGDSFFSVFHAHPNRPDYLYVLGYRLRRSIDGGKTYDVSPYYWDIHPDNHFIAFDKEPSRIYIGNDGGIYRSNKFGDKGSWSFVGEGITNVEFYDIALAATDENLVIGGTQDNGTIRYDAPNSIWNEVRGGDGSTVAIDHTNADSMYSMDQYAKDLQRSPDGGKNWIPFATGLPNTGCSHLHYQIHPGDPSILLASCNGLWRITSPTGVWKMIFKPKGESVVRSTVDARNDIYYTGTDRGNVYAARAGSDWSLEPDFKNITGGSCKDLEVDPNEPTILYGVFNGEFEGRVYRFKRQDTNSITLQGADITSDLKPKLRTHCIEIDRMNPFTLYVGTSRGVFRGRSFNRGQTWQWAPYNNGLPLADVRDLEIHPKSYVMRAGTFGRGAFEVHTGSPIGSFLSADGVPTYLRVQIVGEGYGIPGDYLDTEIVIRLSNYPDKAFGFQLRNDRDSLAHKQMLKQLRLAFKEGSRVRLEYIRTGLKTGEVKRVINLPK